MRLEQSFAVSSEYIDSVLQIAPSLHGSDGKQSGASIQSFQPLGLIARPRDPDTVDGPGAGFVFAFDGGEGFGWPTSDPRATSKVPPLEPGGTALYSSPGGCLVFNGTNGSMLILVPNEDASKNHCISIDSENASIQVVHADGMSLRIGGDDANSVLLVNKDGSAFIGVNDDGVIQSGAVTLNGGLVLGQVASALPVALQPALFTWATTATTILSALSAAVNVLAPGTVTPAQLAQLATDLAALNVAGKTTKLSASP